MEQNPCYLPGYCAANNGGWGRNTNHTVPRLLGSHFCGSLKALLIKYNFEMKDDPV